MPTLILHTNLHVQEDKRSALLARLSGFTAEASRKPEQWVMVLLDDGREMSFAGTQAPCAFVEFKSINLADAAIPRICAELSALLQTELGLDPARVYIEFTAAQPQQWGWNGSTF